MEAIVVRDDDSGAGRGRGRGVRRKSQVRLGLVYEGEQEGFGSEGQADHFFLSGVLYEDEAHDF